MSLPRYPDYKPSGVEWLGDVPGHWQVLPCRALVDEQTAKNHDGKNEDYLSLMANVGIIPYAEKGDVGNKKPEDLTKCKLVSKGDFVINSMNYGIGSYGLSALNGICSPVYIVLRPRLERIESRYAFRIFESRAFQTFAQSFGNGILEHRSAINWDILKSIGVGIPPKEEQINILNFLDRETGKIDELIVEQRRLVELLAEKRQTVISHAITKGLNPNAPMQDSGIEWLGEVPGHWDVIPLKKGINFQEGPGIMAVDFHDEGIPLLRVSGVQARWASLDGCNYLDPEKVDKQWSHFRLARGDLLISASASMGTVCEVDEQTEGAISYTGLIRLRGKDGVMTRSFVRSLVISSIFSTQIDLLKAGSTIQHFGPTHLSQMKVVCPPIEEQVGIAKFIDCETEKFDALTAEANRAIALLQERRSALISAAVTGKIDVRVLEVAQ